MFIQEHSAKVRRPREKREAALKAEANKLMQADGWRVWNLESVRDATRGRGFGEPGMPDTLYIRKHTLDLRSGGRHLYEVLYVEWKIIRPGRKGAERAQVHQKLWHAAERGRGFWTVIAGEDFTATLDGFINWYASNNLNRSVNLASWTKGLQRADTGRSGQDPGR